MHMLKWFQGALILCLLAIAPAARAGLIVEGSVGKGVKVSPGSAAAEQANVMIAPGVTVPFLRLELGFAWDLPDKKDSKSNLELRPMVMIDPPLLPIYGRVVFAVANLVHGKTEIAYGAALGLKVGLGPIGVFAEAGFLPRSRESDTGASHINWVIEGRLGASLGF
jgi:hypothetical protein